MRRLAIMAATIAALGGVAACNQAEPPTTGNTTAQAESDDSTEGTIRTRQASYKDMARASKAIADQLKARDPSVAEIQANAQRIADHAPQILNWFPEGSGPDSGVRTRAKAEIWSNPEGFGTAAARFIATAEEFNIIAGTGDLAAIRAAQADLGPSCRNCHDQFRAPEE